MSSRALLWAARQWGRFTAPDGTVHIPHAIDQAVLLALADYADKTTRTAWPSMGTLCDRLQASRSRVARSLQMWADLGLVSIDTRWGATGRQRSNSYRLRLDQGKGPAGKPVYKPVDNSGEGVSDLTGGGSPSGGSNSSPLEPTYEPSKEDPALGEPVDEFRSESPSATVDSTEKESPAGMGKDGPSGPKSVQQVKGRPSRDYLVSNLRAAREAARKRSGNPEL